MKRKTCFAALLIALVLAPVSSLAQWTKVSANPGFSKGADTALLLTDGSVLVHNKLAADWKRLIPDINGSYVNGTWVNAGSMPATAPNSDFAPLYFASAILADGRVVAFGGEYNVVGGSAADINEGAIYDPATNAWTALNPPNGGASPWNRIGDSSCTVLPNGNFLLANQFSQAMAVLDPATLTWTNLNATNKADNNSEETWTLLPDGTIITVDCQNGTVAEKYSIANDQWYSAGSTQVTLPSNAGYPGYVPEIGPQILRPDGTVVAFGATSNTAIYTPDPNINNPGAWVAGPTFPSGDDCADAPGVLLRNGNVLVAASPGLYSSPTTFYEFDGTNLNPVGGTPNAGSVSSFQVRLLLLPTGEVLQTDGTNDVEIYNSAAVGQDSWRPVVTSFPAKIDPSNSYTIAGMKFNGLSEANSYGDDASNATNYPLVRITNIATGHVFYCKTHGHSRMGVETASSTEIITTHFDTPSGLESGPSRLEVVANGIPSAPVTVNGPALAYNAENDLQFGTVCLGTSSYLTLQIFNVGGQDLTINSVDRSSGSTDFSVLANPATPLTIAPGDHVDFTVRYTPTAVGPETATITISSNDPNKPTVDIATSGIGDVPQMAVTPPLIDFGQACPGDVVNQSISINNTGDCTLKVTGIVLSGADAGQFAISVPPLPINIAPGSAITVQASFKPTTFYSSPKTATVTVQSNATNSPQTVTLSGSAPPPVIGVSPCPLDFGTVCANDLAGHFRTIQVCNSGHCPLNVSNVTVTGSDFAVIGPTSFTVAAGNCVNVTIKFTPTSAGTKSATLTVSSNDPSNPTIHCTVSGTTPPSSISAPSCLAFPPTVIQSAGACSSSLPLPIHNTGTCNLTITNITVTGDFSISGINLPGGLPAVLAPGELLGDGNLVAVFKPTAIARYRTGTITITYVSDPASGATQNLVINLYGEGVTTGARVLVTIGGAPAANVEKLQLQRIVGNRSVSNEVTQNLKPISVATQGCEPAFVFHREWGGVSNRVQLLTGSYQLTATVVANGKRSTKTVYFSLDTCTFNPNIVIGF